MPRHFHLIDTSVASDNVGDEIIVEEARHHLSDLLSDAYVTTSSGHDGLGPYGRDLAAAADVVFLLGTNALSARFRKSKFIWTVTRRDFPALEGKVVLLGVGANRDFDAVEWRQRRFLNRLLSKNYSHSVRDDLGLRILQEVGVQGDNTACPTLWRYADRPPQVPSGKAPAVVFTLTKHKADPSDKHLVETLLRLYDRVYFWPQQMRDLGYLKDIASLNGIEVIAPNLGAYDALLKGMDVDVVGTRLHGGIRGLMHGRRVLVIAIDNRAREVGAENLLPTLLRSEMVDKLEPTLTGAIRTALAVPGDRIERFLDQFRRS